ncbi:hypothetical protein BT63DRAFT_450522 [Microthyrium microscopicum]|uniref:Uncharacterized protein n=1 Tax=Microthyrium microscopicum TaxID=703497 RepID=A0A6A6UTF4_9PEZI|nr:hypothetical protein BT63DRAFT_450522 [Microthyrium microscopicum]
MLLFCYLVLPFFCRRPDGERRRRRIWLAAAQLIGEMRFYSPSSIDVESYIHIENPFLEVKRVVALLPGLPFICDTKLSKLSSGCTTRRSSGRFRVGWKSSRGSIACTACVHHTMKPSPPFQDQRESQTNNTIYTDSTNSFSSASQILTSHRLFPTGDFAILARIAAGSRLSWPTNTSRPVLPITESYVD